ncbi:expressed unknown protein [Seminavis robusta]|uniref:Uncharacterized protein n=1 Tax=Seminavis robusta TaxID=568900 RepID=A0A9N8HZ94_9STRA|nr:expressed unknown protein [Seminavis robusta]|eukprot:Sro3390_g121141.1  (115) ;mRNA; f:718-1062
MTKCPFRAAQRHVHASHGQPFSRAHFKITKRPLSAAEGRCTHPMDHHLHAAIGEFPYVHFSQQSSMSLNPINNHFLEPTLKFPNVHFQPPQHMFVHPMDNHFHEPTLEFPNAHR